MTKNIRRLAVLTAFVMLLTLVPLASAAETKMVVTGNYVRLRDVSSNSVLGTYNSGTVVVLLSTGNGYMYKVRIEKDGKVGLMYKDYLKSYTDPAGSGSNANTNNNNTNTNNTNNNNNGGANSSANANAAVQRNNDTVRATVTKQTNVRATASNNSKIIGTLKTRTTVSVLGQKGSKVFITTSKMSGYVTANSLMMNNVKSYTATVNNVKNGSYKIYQGSTGTGKVVGSAKSNSKITVLHQGSNWSYVKVGNVYGYIANGTYTVKKKL